MKTRTKSVAAHLVVPAAVLAGLFVPAVTAHAATIPTATVPTATATHEAGAARSPSGACVRAAVLLVRDRHQLGNSARAVGVLDAVVTHPHVACSAVVSYLRQDAA